MNIDEILDDPAGGQAVQAKSARRALLTRGRTTQPIVAGWPQVSLLPPEIRGEAQQRSVRRAILGGVVAVALLVGGAVALANTAATSSHDRLQAKNAELAGLQAKVAKFADVRRLQAEIDLAKAAQRVGSSTAIDWQARVDEIEALKPSAFTVTAITTDSATPIADFEQSASPLEGTRVATLTMTATSSGITELPLWLRALPGLDDVVDVSPAVSGGDDNGYTVVLTVHLNEKAYVTPLEETAK